MSFEYSWCRLKVSGMRGGLFLWLLCVRSSVVHICVGVPVLSQFFTRPLTLI